MKYIFVCLVLCILALSACNSTESKQEVPVSATTVIETQATPLPKQSLETKAISEKLKHDDKIERRYDVEYKTLNAGSNARVSSRIIRSAKELESVRDLNDFTSQIDFTKQAVVVASAGSCTTGGYSILLASAVLKEDVLDVTFVVNAPGPFDIVTQAFTYPYVVVLVNVDATTEIEMNVVGGGDETKLER